MISFDSRTRRERESSESAGLVMLEVFDGSFGEERFFARKKTVVDDDDAGSASLTLYVYVEFASASAFAVVALSAYKGRLTLFC